METKRYEDCYVTYAEEGFAIGNSKIRREYRLADGNIYPGRVVCQKTGYVWQNTAEEGQCCGNFGFDMKDAKQTFLVNTSDNDGLSDPFFVVSLLREKNGITISAKWEIYPGLPFISGYSVVKSKTKVTVQLEPGSGYSIAATGIEAEAAVKHAENDTAKNDTIDIIGLPNAHLKVKAVKLFDKTDLRDTLLSEEEQLLYSREDYRATGNIFIFQDYIKDSALMVVKESPTHLSALKHPVYDMHVPNKAYAALTGSGMNGATVDEDGVLCYGSTVGVGGKKTIAALYKEYYRAVYRGDKTEKSFIMTNTWGDRSQDSAVCESFMLSEIKTAGELGADIVQIDDGWQSGITSNSKLQQGGVFEGYYTFDQNFWQVNRNKFPNGLQCIAQNAAEKGVRLGLWFSPDSSNDFANWEKDTAVLLHLYRDFHISCFKLDGVKIRNKTAERNYIRFLTAVNKESGGGISFNQDITAEDRLGYLYQKQFGTLFVENRYTDWGNYYPHNTLKNLWSLSKYFPVNKFQFEVLNQRRNADRYINDPLAPGNYSIDYLFASVMVANPLLWMELSHLQKEDQERLRAVICCYRQVRSAFFAGSTEGIGSMPDGTSFTGFQVVCGTGKGYFLFLRELGSEESFRYIVKGLTGRKVHMSVLCSNLAPQDLKIESFTEED